MRLAAAVAAAAATKSLQLCLTLCDPIDHSSPGSSVHGIFQARELEWVAIAFFEAGWLGIVKFSKIRGQHSGDGVIWEAFFF